MKKKFLMLFLMLMACLCLCLGLAACGGKDPAHTHSFGTYVYNNDATCTEDGTETATCSCGETDTRTKAGTKGHRLAYHAPTATCTQDGQIEYWQCSVCNKKFADENGETAAPEDLSVKASGHSYTVENKCEVCGAALEYTEGLAFKEKDDGTYCVTGFADIENISVTDLVIPYGYNGKAVTEIMERAFYNCISLTSVTIPDSVTSIGNGAFWNCTSITSVTIGDGVTEISSGTFEDSPIKEATVPGAACSAISNNALTEVTITSGKIWAYAFRYSYSLTNITIGENVTEIGNNAFDNTEYYKDASNWTGDALYIGKYLIAAKTTLSGTYTIRQGTKLIANYVFQGNKSLTSITIPDSVTTIGVGAFSGCSSFTSMTIPDSVVEIGGYSFPVALLLRA